MFDTIAADLRRKADWYDYPPGWRSTLRMAVSDGSTAQILYRGMRWCQTHGLKPLAFLVYRLNAAVGHAVIEIWRGDDKARHMLIPDLVSTSQFLSIPVFFAGLAILLLRRPTEEVSYA